MKIDYVYPSRKIFHDTWNTGNGWVKTLERMGLLGRAFALEAEKSTDFFNYLSAVESDILILLGPDHFMPFLVNSVPKRDIWHKLRVPTVCICWESIVKSLFPGYMKRTSNALQCFDYFLYADEADVNFFHTKQNRACFAPVCVDGKSYRVKMPINARKNRLFFFGKTTNFGIKGVYEERRQLLKQLLEKDVIDFVSQYISTSDSAEELVDLYNKYAATINLPTNHGGYTQRVFEAIACGTLLFQYRLEEQPLYESLFEEYKHYIPYEARNLDELIKQVNYYLKHINDLEKITIQAREEVLAKHTIEQRLNQIIKFVETGEKIEYQLLPELKPQKDNKLAIYSYHKVESYRAKYSGPIIVVDGVFFQLYSTGIARVWRSLLQEWAKTELIKHIVILDRAVTTPEIPGLWYRQIPAYSYNNTDADKQMLQQVCDEEGADLFISTYYTTPISTPSVFMAYDMIPEVLGANFKEPMWREKHHAIGHASSYISISESTARDLVKFFPDITPDEVTVAHCGVFPTFTPATTAEISVFKYKYGISKPYFLLVGAGSNYKNAILFFRAFAQLQSKQGFEIVCTGSGVTLANEYRQYASGSVLHSLILSDEELKVAYSGAVALVYPSLYEGFGMPVAEALACACPVITCANASIPEVAGEAAIYVDANDVDGLTDALCEVQKPKVRNSLIDAGLEQAKKFSWGKMADIISTALMKATLGRLNLRDINLIIFPDWRQAEETVGLELQKVIKNLVTHTYRAKMTLLIDNSNITAEDADLILSSVAMNLLMEEELEVDEGPEIVLLGELSQIQWSALITQLQGRIKLEHENGEAIAQLKAENIPVIEFNNLSENIQTFQTKML